MKKKQNEDKKISKRSLFITIFLMLLVIVTGTYAWYSWRTNDTAMVLTIGDIEKVRVTLSPYQIKGTFSPTLTYTGNEYTQVTAVNNDSSAGKISLFYRINSIDTNLKSTYFKYTVLKSADGSSYSEYSSGNFSTASSNSDFIIFEEEEIAANSTYYYRVYIWIDGSTNDNTEMQGSVFNAELRASILDVESLTAYAVYSADDTSLRFYSTADVINTGDTYNNLTATAVYTGIDTEEYDYENIPWIDYRESITSVVFEDEVSPVSTNSWFADFYSCVDFDLVNLDTSNVKDMSWMFYAAGFTNTHGSGTSGTGALLLDLSTFKVSSVEYMTGMFEYAGRDATSFKLIGLNDWAVSSVIDMSEMFAYTGFNYATTWDIGDLSGWDVSNVENMSWMFRSAGSFYELGSSANGVWTVGDISGWNVSKVTNMSEMFRNAGQNATTWSIGDVSSWNTSNVTDMSNMFRNAGVSANYSLNLSSWNVGQVTSYTYFNDGVSSKITAPNFGTSS